jgi:hypothetical protein
MPGRDDAREVYRTSDYLRSTVRNELYDRRLTDRLVEIATEGGGAITNGWTPPPIEASSETTAGDAEGAGEVVDETAEATSESIPVTADETETDGEESAEATSEVDAEAEMSR